MDIPPLWFLHEDLGSFDELSRALVRDARLGVVNDGDMSDYFRELVIATGDVDAPWPEEYPRPKVVLPVWFAPDFWSCGGYDFASRRLREVLGQDADVVQFVPFDLAGAGIAAEEQDYRWMRVLARQPVMDRVRSEYRTSEVTNVVTGKVFRNVRHVENFVFLDGIEPRTEIFLLEENTVYTLVTDALALRVLRAGCTGIAFRDRRGVGFGRDRRRLRSLDGIVEPE